MVKSVKFGQQLATMSWNKKGEHDASNEKAVLIVLLTLEHAQMAARHDEGIDKRTSRKVAVVVLKSPLSSTRFLSPFVPRTHTLVLAVAIEMARGPEDEMADKDKSTTIAVSRDCSKQLVRPGVSSVGHLSDTSPTQRLALFAWFECQLCSEMTDKRRDLEGNNCNREKASISIKSTPFGCSLGHQLEC